MPRLGLGDHLVGFVAAAQLLDLAAQLGDDAPVLLALGLLAGAELAVDLDHRVLEVEQRVRALLRREELEQRLALLDQRLPDELVDVLLDRAVAAAVEGLGDPLGESLVARLERPGEPLAQLARLALELGPDVVDLGGGALALEHPGADLDRVADRLAGRVPGLGALAHELGGAPVLDRQPLDHEPVVERAHRAVGRAVVEGELGSLGRFHADSRR